MSGQLWYPAALRVPEAQNRVSGPPQPKYGAILHSMVGRVRPSQTNHSWQLSVYKDGTVEQHAPVTAWCWHSGDRDDPVGDVTNNRDLFGIEHEGGPEGNESEPLTAAQINATSDILAWAVQEGHLRDLRLRSGLWEHNWIPEARTACPSGRIPWARVIGETRERLRPSTPPDDDQEDEAMRFMKREGQAAVYAVQGWHRYHIANEESLRRLQYLERLQGRPGIVERVDAHVLAIYKPLDGKLDLTGPEWR